MIWASIRDNIFNILCLVRFHQWIDKVQRIIIASLIILLFNGGFTFCLKCVALFVIYLITLFSYGYLINSYADRKKDLAVGRNDYGNFSDSFVKKFLVVLLAINVIIPFYCQDPLLILLMVSGLFFASFYSLKPIRCKEKGVAGLLLASIFEYYPLLVWLVFTPQLSWLVWYLFGWLIIIGFVVGTAHQLSDYSNDKKTLSKTYIVRRGIPHARRLIRVGTFVLGVYIISFLALVNFTEGLLVVLILSLFSVQHVYAVAHVLATVNNSERPKSSSLG